MIVLRTCPNLELPLLLAANGISAGQLALLGMIVAATVLTLLSIRRKREGGPSPRAYAREMAGQIREEKAVQSDMAEIMLRLQQVAREINAQLDAKFVRLERCIADADRRIERMDAPVGGDTRRKRLDVTVGERTSQEAPAPEPTEMDRVRRKVQAMTDRGVSASEIARAVGKPLGEVELMIALGKTRPIRAVGEPARTGGG